MRNLITMHSPGSRLLAMLVAVIMIPAIAFGQDPSQSITVNVQNASVKEVISQIEKRSGYSFVYKDADVDLTRKIDINKTAPVQEIVKEIFPDNDVVFENRMIVLRKADVQNGKESGIITVSGVVLDNEGQPLSGVVVMRKGSNTNAAITDIEGRYSIKVPSDAVLVASLLGFKDTEESVRGRSSVNFHMPLDRRVLEESVVVGYGVQKKSDLTGSIASITTEDLQKRPQPNIIHALKDMVPGLNITMRGNDAEGSQTTTRIRGTKSINADNKPLIVLDGVPFDGAWSELNSNDIQSIEVLKDASSVAIYGARGANGVILITSKRGEKGKLSVSYDAYVTIDKPYNFPDMMNGEEFYRYKEEALRLSNTTEPTPDNPTPWMGAFQDTELRMHNEGKDTDWMDLATRSGIRQQHNISFRGGADKTRFFITLNYVNNKGTAVGNTFKRYSVRFNLDQEFTKWLSFSTSTQLGRYDRGGATASFTRAVRMNPLAEAYNEDGSIRTTAWEDSSEAFCVNPLSSLNNRRKNLNFKVMTNNSIEIKPPFLKGFSYKLNTGYTYSNTSYRQYEGLDTYYGKRYNGILETTDSHTEDWLIENIFSYIRDFGKHHIFLTALYSAESKEYESNEAQGTGFPNDVMYYYQINKASTIEGDNEYWKQNHISQMGRINYSYDSRYLLTLTARRDGYSAFGKDKKFGIFPSAAIGWNLSNERFFKESRVAEVISRLKFRLSWGENGNEAISAYSSLPNLSTFNYLDVSHSATYGFYPQRLASPDLGWETTTSTNFGFDISLWDDRVQSTFDYYWTRTKDLLLNRSIPIINGTDSLMSNIGKTKGNGFEFQIISNNITKKDFQWSTTLNLSHHHTEIVNVGLYDENGKPMDDIASGWFIGEPIDVNYSYRNIGVWQYVDKSKNISEPQDDRNPDSIPGYIKYKDMNGDGLITTEDRDIIGSREPWLNFGLMNNFSYKDFYLSIFITGQFGVTMLNNLYTTSTSTYRNNRLMVNFWTPDNPTNDYPMNSADTHVSPHGACFYEKTDYVRLADITFGYRLPEKIVKKTFLKGVEAYINVKNPYTWTNWTGMDPEFVNGESQQYANPPVRSYTFGIKVTL